MNYFLQRIYKNGLFHTDLPKQIWTLFPPSWKSFSVISGVYSIQSCLANIRQEKWLPVLPSPNLFLHSYGILTASYKDPVPSLALRFISNHGMLKLPILNLFPILDYKLLEGKKHTRFTSLPPIINTAKNKRKFNEYVLIVPTTRFLPWPETFFPQNRKNGSLTHSL